MEAILEFHYILVKVNYGATRLAPTNRVVDLVSTSPTQVEPYVRRVLI